ncbi:DUF1972 domain-containing protein [Treponema berlinense]|uniref:DUF1972 domain-containing protein n=1 Tax=Treponema berlinense TaxID=225004 RepID=UPI0026F2ECD6|nr:DUF1972 domain-containing protein [Treponema berlinense]
MLKNKTLRISVIGTVGVPACYGGFESLVDNLLDFTPPDVEYTVFCSGKKYENRLESYKGAKLVYLEKDANGIESIFYDFEGMKRSLDSDIMLILGVSGCMFLPYIRRRFRGKIITNIDGLEWRRDKWKWYAKKLLKFSEKMAVRHSDIVIGDNKGITDYIKAEYKKEIQNKRVELIAYGGDQVLPVEDDSLFEKYPFCRTPYAVTVCRIEPENNVHLILEAFSKMPKKNLVFVGNWERSEYGKCLKEKYSGFSNIHLLDPVYEPHTVNWLRSNAFLYVHGHSAGGTNPSLVEAMNLGLAVLAFDCVYNRATTEEKALYWKTSDDIVRNVMEDSSHFEEVSCAMKEAGKRLYSWKTIAELYNALY